MVVGGADAGVGDEAVGAVLLQRGDAVAQRTGLPELLACAVRAARCILVCSSSLTTRMYQLPALMMASRISTERATMSEPFHSASMP